MKCHYVIDKVAGKVLIPCCWSVVLSNDIDDCTCSDDFSFAKFEKVRYNTELAKLKKELAELKRENNKLLNLWK